MLGRPPLPHPPPPTRGRFSLYEPVEFIRHFLLDKLEFSRVRDSVAVHIPCSSKKMGIEETFMKVGLPRLPRRACCAALALRTRGGVCLASPPPCGGPCPAGLPCACLLP